MVHNAGSVFLGRSCPEPLGDYLAGPNHTLPTSGTARYSSPLGVDDFCRRSSYLYYTPAALEKVSEDVMRFARREGAGRARQRRGPCAWRAVHERFSHFRARRA